MEAAAGRAGRGAPAWGRLCTRVLPEQDAGQRGGPGPRMRGRGCSASLGALCEGWWLLRRAVRDPGLTLQRNPGMRTTDSGVVITCEASPGEQSGQASGTRTPGQGPPAVEDGLRRSRARADAGALTTQTTWRQTPRRAGAVPSVVRNRQGTRAVKPDAPRTEVKRSDAWRLCLAREAVLGRRACPDPASSPPHPPSPPHHRPPRRVPTPQIHGATPGIICDEWHHTASPLLSGFSLSIITWR